MTNPYYNHSSGKPVNVGRGLSSDMRNEFDLIVQGFDQFPTPTQLAGGSSNYVIDTGTSNNLVVPVPSASITSLFNGLQLEVLVLNPNTASVSITVGGFPTVAVTRADGTSLLAGDLVAGQVANLIFANGSFQYDGKNSATAVGGLPTTGGTMTGALNEAKGANIASTASVNLTTATGNFIHITGTTNITGIILAVGAERTIIFDGILTLTNSASLILPGGFDIITAAGDAMIVRGESGGITRVINYQPIAGITVNQAKGANIASAGTINLNTTTGDYVHVTGAVTITAITLNSGRSITVVFDGALTLTHNATTLILPTGANIVTAAGDTMVVRGDGLGNTRVISYNRANGDPVFTPARKFIASVTPTAVANIDFLNIFTSQFNNYYITFNGIIPSANDSLRMRVANTGVVDTGSNYFSDISTSGVGASVSATSFDVITTFTFLNSGGGSATFTLLNVNDTTNNKQMTGNGFIKTAAGNYKSVGFGGAYIAANTVSGIRLFWNGGSNFVPNANGSIEIYGERI